MKIRITHSENINNVSQYLQIGYQSQYYLQGSTYKINANTKGCSNILFLYSNPCTNYSVKYIKYKSYLLYYVSAISKNNYHDLSLKHKLR